MPDGVNVTNYEEGVDYLALMTEAAEDGSTYALHMGAIYETQRNMKIVSQKLEEEATNIFNGYENADQIRISLKNYLETGKTDTRENVEPPAQPVITYYTDADAVMLAKTMYNEARGINSKIELACVAWTVLNRVDAGYGTIYQVLIAPNQFAYSSFAPTTNDYNIDLLELSIDVLDRWSREKNGEVDVGRVLPNDYLWYGGHSGHNWFRNEYNNFKNPWDYSLPSPYEN